MRPYTTIRLIDEPDVLDIKEQGRSSHVGMIPRGESRTRYVRGDLRRPVTRIVHNDRGYNKPAAKTAVRRTLKRGDKARTLKAELEQEKES